MHHSFDTPHPIELYVEIGRGQVSVRAAEVTTTTVRVEGRTADQVEITHEADHIAVIAPRVRTGFFGGGDADLTIEVVTPTGSGLVTKLGSADLVTEGTLQALRARTGSGDITVEDVTGPCVIDTGSGDIDLGNAGSELRAKSGSGDISVGTTGAAAGISTGSGDVRIKQTHAPVVLKTGSGDLRVDRAEDDVQLSSGSGDLSVGLINRGALQAKNATGDVSVGVPAGIPIWTDVSSVTGQISSNLQGGGQPAAGEDHLELRISTVSGDVRLTET